MSVDSVHNELHLKCLTEHLGWRLPVPGASAAADVEALMDSGSGITALSEKVVEAVRGQPGMAKTTLTKARVRNARVVSSLGQRVQYGDEIESTPLDERNGMGTSQVHHAVYPAPWGMRCDYHGTEDAEMEIRHRGHDETQGICAECMPASNRRVLYGSPLLVLCCWRRRLSRRSGRAVMGQVTWTIPPY